MPSDIDKQYSASSPNDHPQSDIYRDTEKGGYTAIGWRIYVLIIKSECRIHLSALWR